MKHLKLFNESVSDKEYHKQVVIDVFQDVIDDYNIEYVNNSYGAFEPVSDGEMDSAYTIYDDLKHKSICFRIVYPYDKNPSMYDDVIKSSVRLKSLGYDVNVRETPNWFIGGVAKIDIEIKYPNINENKKSDYDKYKDHKYNLDLIKDIFSDVVDEFGLYKYDGIHDDLFYNINTGEGNSIGVWIADTNKKDLSIDKEILDSEEIKGFEKRLKNIGYHIVDKSDDPKKYYHKLIYML